MSISDSTAQRYTEQDPDVRLMLRVRDDDAAAFEELVSRYQARLLNVMAHLMGSREQADDLAQEVFLRIFRARKSYKPGAKFTTWLFTIANNVASNARRSKARRREVNISTNEGDTSSMSLEEMAKEASALMPTRQFDRGEMAEVVRLAMQTLNERQRMAVLLSKFEGLSYVDIAEAMDLTPQAIKSLLSRARGNLRQALEPYLNGGSLSSGTKPK